MAEDEPTGPEQQEEEAAAEVEVVRPTVVSPTRREPAPSERLK